MNDKAARIGAVLLLLSPLGLLAFLLFFVLVASDSNAAVCNPDRGITATIDDDVVPDVEGYDAEQLTNAAHIIRAGSDLKLSGRDVTIGVMTAIGESTLRVLDHGDAAGPDSRGLFQQRANGAWGSYADRMDPYISATNFFEVLRDVEGRDALPPTIVAHRVQVNADPYHYEPFFADAVTIVEAIGGVDLGLEQRDGGAACSGIPAEEGEVAPGGWAQPGRGPVTSGFGMRTNPVTGIYRLHAGTDLAAGGCDGPIWAAQSGTVTFAGFDSSGTGIIEIDHGRGTITKYLHMWSHGINVSVGQRVEAGQPIGLVGDSGNSTACHLHFEVHVNGQPTDPEPFMTRVGAPLA
ncbi:M23 family metallopeptidase [Myceligenerans crystallogenes]|uniref:M23ase beta-sheet core domain-containing protein n=1 Tax=Myceligenerans crystallogenes TaxID=316335 RepID=A0ABP4ZPB4_9MICO